MPSAILLLNGRDLNPHGEVKSVNTFPSLKYISVRVSSISNVAVSLAKDETENYSAQEQRFPRALKSSLKADPYNSAMHVQSCIGAHNSICPSQEMHSNKAASSPMESVQNRKLGCKL